MKSIGLNKFLRTVLYILGFLFALMAGSVLHLQPVAGVGMFLGGVLLLVLGSFCADKAKRLKQEKEMAVQAGAKEG